MADSSEGAGRRVIVDAGGNKSYMGTGEKTQAESAPPLTLQVLGAGGARAAGRLLDGKRMIDDGTGDPARVEYGGNIGSSIKR